MIWMEIVMKVDRNVSGNSNQPTNQATNQPSNQPTRWLTDWLPDSFTNTPSKKSRKASRQAHTSPQHIEVDTHLDTNQAFQIKEAFRRKWPTEEEKLSTLDNRCKAQSVASMLKGDGCCSWLRCKIVQNI